MMQVERSCVILQRKLIVGKFAACDVMNSITFISSNQKEEYKQHVSEIMVRQSVKKKMILIDENGTELKHNEGKNENNEKM